VPPNASNQTAQNITFQENTNMATSQTTQPETILMKPTILKSFTKQVLTLTAVLAFGAAGISIASASSQVLFNADLNQIAIGPQVNASPLGWSVTCFKTISGTFSDGCDSETFANGNSDPDPNGYGLFLKPFQGTTNVVNDLLNVYFYQDNPTYPGSTFILSAYACGQASYSGYQTGAPNYPGTGLYVQFLDGSGNVLTNYQYDLIAAGLSNLGDPHPTTQFTTPSYTAPAGTAKVRAGIYMTNVWGTSGAQSLTADDFDLEATPPPGAPLFTTEPSAATAPVGGHATFTVVASPAPTSYTWTLNGAPVSGPEFSGQTTATLTVSPASTNDVGRYQCQVQNGSGGNYSTFAPLALNSINLFPTVILTGTIGDNYVIGRSSSPSGPFTPFSTNRITMQPQYIPDFTLPISPNEFYLETFLH